MKNSKRTTMLDVAKLSGVSYQTVSRVLNNHPNVAPETRDRVLKIIEALKYRPSQAARLLAAKRTQALAVISYSMHHFGPTQMIANIDRCAREAGYDLIVAHIDPDSRESIDAAVDRVLRWSADGVLLIAPAENRFSHELVREFADTPLIQIDIAPGSNVPSVIIDQRDGSRMITQFLLNQGHRYICEISGPLNWFSATARHQGITETLAAHGLTLMHSVAGDWSVESGWTTATRLLDLGAYEAGCTALVVGNDQMALGAISALRARGLHVPTDLSVVGFDDIPEAAYFDPPLTTVRQDFARLALQGVEYLLQCIEDPTTHTGQHVIPPQLIERRSTRIVQV